MNVKPFVVLMMGFTSLWMVNLQVSSCLQLLLMCPDLEPEPMKRPHLFSAAFYMEFYSYEISQGKIMECKKYSSYL